MPAWTRLLNLMLTTYSRVYPDFEGIGFDAVAIGTPATKLLAKAGVNFKVHEYAHDPASGSFGLEAAEKLGVNPDQVFKTLIVNVDEIYVVAIVPVTRQVSLKSLARMFGAKRSILTDPATAARLSGYVVGGISPLGQKRQLTTILAKSAIDFETIFVSGGRRGFDIEISPDALATLLSATFADIAI